jgi:inorganic pyrophosphatase/exopolyphosphatase
MFNPLVDDLSKLDDSEVDSKISELGRKYFQTRNPQLQSQIAVILEMYKQEMATRRAKAMQQIREQNGEKGLDNLINIS